MSPPRIRMRRIASHVDSPICDIDNGRYIQRNFSKFRVENYKFWRKFAPFVNCWGYFVKLSFEKYPSVRERSLIPLLLSRAARKWACSHLILLLNSILSTASIPCTVLPGHIYPSSRRLRGEIIFEFDVFRFPEPQRMDSWWSRTISRLFCRSFFFLFDLAFKKGRGERIQV